MSSTIHPNCPECRAFSNLPENDPDFHKKLFEWVLNHLGFKTYKDYVIACVSKVEPALVGGEVLVKGSAVSPK
jgi:hypothetical protein